MEGEKKVRRDIVAICEKMQKSVDGVALDVGQSSSWRKQNELTAMRKWLRGVERELRLIAGGRQTFGAAA